jgi:drug/metabolite transporter (DMT)-like permease
MTSQNLRGMAYLTIAMGLFIASDSCLKVAMRGLPVFELSMIRGLAGSVICIALAVAMGDLQRLPRVADPLVLMRSAMEVAGNFLFVLAISQAPIADVTSVALVAPLLLLIAARILWGEKLGAIRIGLICAGFFGALLVAQPGSTTASPFALLGFGCAIFVTVRDLLSRTIAGDIPPSIVALGIALLMAVGGLVCMLIFEIPKTPDIENTSLAIVAAGLMVGGQMLAFLAYKIGEVKSVAPFMYSVTVWAGVLGYLVFGDVPNSLALLGIALVVVAGLGIILFDGTAKRTEQSLAKLSNDH